MNQSWNKSQSVDGPPIDESFTQPELAVPIVCNVHPWMRAYAFVYLLDLLRVDIQGRGQDQIFVLALGGRRGLLGSGREQESGKRQRGENATRHEAPLVQLYGAGKPLRTRGRERHYRLLGLLQ